jgi:hypothetical protein
MVQSMGGNCNEFDDEEEEEEDNREIVRGYGAER